MDHRKILAAAAAFTLMATAFSCGRDAADSSSTSDAPAGVSDAASPVGEDSSQAAQSASEASTQKSSSASKEKSTEASSQAATNADGTPAQKTTTAGGNTPSSNGGGDSSGGQTGQQDDNGSGGSSDGGSGSSDTPQQTPASGGGNSTPSGSDKKNDSTPQKTTTAGGNSGGGSAQNQEPEEEEKSYTAEIKLGSKPSISGENAVADGSTVKITSGGDYIFTGKVSDGQIYVSTASEEKVTIILNGVDITCTYGPAIYVDEAKKCTIKVKEGSVNNLADVTKSKVNDGVIFSNDTLRIKGNGTLNINAGNAHGISSDDDVIFDNSICNIKAAKSGICANDDITINGGTLTVNGSTNGLKSKGSINVNGGTSYICGGKKDEKSSIYAAGPFNYTDGYLFAAGNQVSALSDSAKPYIITDLGGTVSGGTAVKLSLNGKEAASFTPSNDFRCVLMLSPELAEGTKFTINAGSNHKGDFTVEEGKNLFSL